MNSPSPEARLRDRAFWLLEHLLLALSFLMMIPPAPSDLPEPREINIPAVVIASTVHLGSLGLSWRRHSMGIVTVVVRAAIFVGLVIAIQVRVRFF